MLVLKKILLNILLFLAVSSPYDALAKDLNFTIADVRLYQKWMTLRGHCSLHVDGVQSPSFVKCVKGLIGQNSKLSVEDAFAIVVYDDLRKESERLSRRSAEIRSDIVDGYTKHEYIRDLFWYNYIPIQEEKYEKLLSFLFIGMIPIVSVVPIFEHSIVYYNPTLDIGYVMALSEDRGALNPNKGYFVFGEDIRGESRQAVPAWMVKDLPIDALIQTTDLMMDRFGYQSLYDLNKSKEADGDKFMQLIGRVAGAAANLRNISSCLNLKMLLIEKRMKSVVAEAIQTNIKIDESGQKNIKVFPMFVAAIGRDTTAIVIAEENPTQMFIFRIIEGICTVQELLYIDLLEGQKDALLKLRRDAIKGGL